MKYYYARYIGPSIDPTDLLECYIKTADGVNGEFFIRWVPPVLKWLTGSDTGLDQLLNNPNNVVVEITEHEWEMTMFVFGVVWHMLRAKELRNA